MGVFKLARAEFIKILKRPSIYVMGVFLAVVLILSLKFFDPATKENHIVKLEGETVSEVYDKFTNINNIAGGDYKKYLFNESIVNSLNKVEFYENLNNRNFNIATASESIIHLYEDLLEQINNNPQHANTTYTAIQNKLNEFITAINNIETMKAENKFFKYFTSSPVFLDFKDTLDYLYTTATNSNYTTFTNLVNSNNYIEALNKGVSANINFVSATIDYYKTDLKLKENNYYNRVINNTTPLQEELMSLKNVYYSAVKNFEHITQLLIDCKYSLVFVNNTHYENLKTVIAESISTIEFFDDVENIGKTSYEKHKQVVITLNSLNFTQKIDTFKNELIDFNIDSKTIDTLKDTINQQVNDLKVGLNESIETINKNPLSENVNDIELLNDLITNYRILAMNTSLMVDNTLNLNALNVIETKNINNYLNFKDFNLYEQQEVVTRTNYFIANGEYNHHFGDVFAFNKNSTAVTNIYDFVFYGMEIATFIIIIFAIFLSASLIAYEFDSGTIKLLAIRPYKRWKILLGKLVATMTFVTLFILFSLLICLIIGASMFPISNTMILAIFNSTTAFVVHPIVLMLINLSCIILEVLFYTVIAMSISAIFKSYFSAVSITFAVFILASALNILFGGALWYSYLPFINVDLFKFFGGNFLGSHTNIINNLFGTTLLSNANCFMSLIIYFATVFVLSAIKYLSFKHRDL